MILYIDSDFKLHTTKTENTTYIELYNFDGKCKEYIEGFRYVPEGAVWVREDGTEFHGAMCVPWKPYSELDNAQREYERQLIENYENKKNALITSYTQGVNSI